MLTLGVRIRLSRSSSGGLAIFATIRRALSPERIVGPRLDGGRAAPSRSRRPLKMVDYLTLDWSDIVLGLFMGQLLAFKDTGIHP